MKSPMWTLTIFLFILVSATIAEDAEDVFSCHGNVGFLKMKKDREKGAIYPRADVIVAVGGDPTTVLCRFNDSHINADDVFFKGFGKSLLSHEVVNASTIRAKISHTEATKYRLQCVLRRPKGDKILCTQFVKAGFPPMDIVRDSMHCISKNYDTLNCTWQYQDNPISVMYLPQYSVPNFIHETPCLTNNAKNTCYWTSRHDLRDYFYINIHGNNTLGKREFSHKIDIPSVVIPDKIPTEVLLSGPKTVTVLWNLSYPIDVFSKGLWHKVEYRLAGDELWNTMKLSSYKHPVREMDIKRVFQATKELPFAHMKYEFRVRLHTMAAPMQEKLWSDFNIVSIYTKAMLPSTSPKTDLSSFEVVEYLDRRDIYVNFQDIDPKYYSGDDFQYRVLAYSPLSDTPLKINPTDVSKAYVKYSMMDFNETRFKIWPQNEMGVGSVYSEVTVPSYVCMPKKTDFFTVIIRNGDGHQSGPADGKVFSLYWVPSKLSEEQCDGGSPDVDFYTIFWCKKSYEERCKEKLFWTDVTDPRLVSHGSNSPLYEKNITGLADGLYTFGVAAISGKYSSGIRWSKCIVDESDAPPAPVNINAYAENPNTVRLKWELKCSSLSAVPLGFKIVYCESEIPDFGHCTSEVKSTNVTKPDAKGHTLYKGLQPGVSYIFSVALLSYIGEGKQSIPVRFKMQEKQPNGPPTSFRVRSVANSSAELSWLAPEPFHRNGKISQYCLYPMDVIGPRNCVPATPQEVQRFDLEGLSPFKEYDIGVTACTKEGCSDFRSTVSFVTRSGRPDSVHNFVLDVSNWRLEWEAGSCNSRRCTFDVKIPLNDTFTYEETVEGNSYLSLNDLELPCLEQDMIFWVRPIGISEENRALYGEWTKATKTANDCPPAATALWIIIIIVVIGIIIAGFVLLVCKFGCRSVIKVFKACTRPINVPRGILENTIKDKKNDHKKTKKNLKIKNDSLFNPPPKAAPAVVPVFPETIPPDDKPWTRSPRTSVSSEEIQLIPSNGDRHGRNMSGSSSNQDSAVMSQSSSTSEPDSPMARNGVHQRISDFTYVQHGIMPDKIPEGYVAARSVPSLPSLLKSNEADALQSTPNLNSPTTAIIMEMGGARRASTGYISMLNMDSDNVSPSHVEPVLGINSPYSKHGSFLASGPQQAYVPAYVMSGPVPDAAQNGYVPPEAYCKVADRESLTEAATTADKVNPYVAVGDPALMRFGISPPTHISPYVQLADANRWAAAGPPTTASDLTPEKCAHAAARDLINQMTPSLSKQSSGYVSQEALTPDNNHPDVVVMSPKRLAVRGPRPKSAGFTAVAKHQSSMV